MPLTPNAVVGPANVSSSEIIVANSAVSTGFGTGNVFRITLDAPSLGGPQYQLDVKIGLTGGAADNVFYSSNNVTSNAALIAALNSQSNAFPGLSPTVLAQVAAAAAGAGTLATPAKGVSGELLLVVTGNVASNAQVSLINPSPADGGLLSALGAGVIATGNVPSTAKVFITVGAKAAVGNVFSYVGSTVNAAGNTVGLSANAIYGATPPFPVGIFAALPSGNTWNLSAATTAVSNGTFNLGAIEQIA
jgi:hypothetical protein